MVQMHTLLQDVPVRPADAGEESRVYVHRHSDARAGHRREYSYLFPAQSSAVATASGAEAERTGHSEVARTEARTCVERWDDSEIFSYPLYKGLAKNTAVFDGVIARYPFEASIASHGQTERGSGRTGDWELFRSAGCAAGPRPGAFTCR